METIIKKSGLIFFHLNQKLKWIFNIRILRNHNTTILFILFFCFSVVFLSFLGIGFSFSHIITYTLVTTAVLFLNLILIGSLNEARKLSKQAPSNCFQFSRNNLNGVRLSELGFIERDRENLNLVLNGAKSGESGHPIPEQSGQGYRLKVVRQSDSNWSVKPAESGQLKT